PRTNCAAYSAGSELSAARHWSHVTDHFLQLTMQYVRPYYIENGPAFFTRPDLARWAARPVSARLSRSERARHLRGGGRPTRFVHQSFSFERGLRRGSARPVLRLFERIGERSEIGRAHV